MRAVFIVNLPVPSLIKPGFLRLASCEPGNGRQARNRIFSFLQKIWLSSTMWHSVKYFTKKKIIVINDIIFNRSGVICRLLQKNYCCQQMMHLPSFASLEDFDCEHQPSSASRWRSKSSVIAVKRALFVEDWWVAHCGHVGQPGSQDTWQIHCGRRQIYNRNHRNYRIHDGFISTAKQCS